MFECPIPDPSDAVVTLAHGGGCKLTQQLIDNVIKPRLNNPWLDTSADSAVLPWSNQALAFSTDSYVVKPLFFPGGNIGDLAITGTVNDLAMSGARAKHLSLGLILEEGLSFEKLSAVIDSMANIAQASGITIVTGDTKVIERGRGDGLYLNTSGIGTMHPNAKSMTCPIEEGDVVIITGDIGRHGLSVMIARNELEIDAEISSDIALLVDPIMALLDSGIPIKKCHDLTRGGLGAGMLEIARSTSMSFILNEPELPISREVDSGCELLGLDPLFVANEGCAVIVVSDEFKENALSCLQDFDATMQARIIGECSGFNRSPSVLVKSEWGTHRRLILPSGEQLPRIC